MFLYAVDAWNVLLFYDVSAKSKKSRERKWKISCRVKCDIFRVKRFFGSFILGQIDSIWDVGISFGSDPDYLKN